MTADRKRLAPSVDVPQVSAEAGMPPEWLEWAGAIERREDFRHRLAKGPERVRVAAALAPQSGERLDPTEAIDFIAAIRRGVVPTEEQDARRRTLRRRS